jgi:hypothetical protein
MEDFSRVDTAIPGTYDNAGRESIAAYIAPDGGLSGGPMARKESSMTNELLRRLAALRGINPRLNSVTDQVSEIVKSVEKTLVEELKIGIDASQWFLTEFGGEGGTSREHYLAFNRVGSAGFRIHVAIVTVRDTSEETGKAGTQEKLNEERILWTSCSRELKLKAFEKLPDLLDSIIAGAESLMQTADSAATKINLMLAEDGEQTAEIEEPEETEEPEESWFKGRSRRRVYALKDAVRAHRQYFIDQGISEAALGTVSFEGWKEDGPGGFVCRDSRGKVRCSVVFVDEDGTAEITFPDGESEQVSIDDV